MMTHLVWQFWLLSISLCLVPGADWAFMISAGVQGKTWRALLGLILGYIMVILAVIAGVGTLILAIPSLLSLLTFFGAGYMVWLAWQIWRSSPTVVESDNRSNDWIKQGITVSASNPKVLLMFLALIPQFLSPQASFAIPLQTLVLGGIHIANCLLIYPLVSISVGISLRYRPQLARRISCFSAVAMLSIAATLVLEQLG